MEQEKALVRARRGDAAASVSESAAPAVIDSTGQEFEVGDDDWAVIPADSGHTAIGQTGCAL
ncbi:hypothetical protein [Nocardia sp. SC052]|uniref:hypothetical protein n=1 Tax=Nocardia sichangensis TaxID=3385975 RepID=UPI00399F1A64